MANYLSQCWRKLAAAGSLLSGRLLDDCSFQQTLLCSELRLLAIVDGFSLVCAMLFPMLCVCSQNC